MESQEPRYRRAFRAVRSVGAALSTVAWVGVLAGSAAGADDDHGLKIQPSLNGALEKLDLKARPADPAPEFVTRSRPRPARLHFMPTALPHAVSPVPVKTSAEIQAAKDALDAAQAKQLAPAPPPVDLTAPAASPEPGPSKVSKAKVIKPKPPAEAD